MIISAIILLIVLFVWGFFIEPELLMVKRYKANFLNGKKIVFISDLHAAKGDKKRIQRIVSKINELNPDLVLSGGDYIKGHCGENTLPIEETAKELSKINARIITVLGNHDGWYDKYTVKTALEENGITVLHNTNIQVDDLYIAGVEDLKTGYSDSTVALENVQNPVILLTHNPDIYYDVEESVDLILAGHVHGGQVRIPFLGALICPSKYGTKISGGDYNDAHNRMIVTKGLGTSILNVRFCNIPEIVVIEG